MNHIDELEAAAAGGYGARTVAEMVKAHAALSELAAIARAAEKRAQVEGAMCEWLAIELTDSHAESEYPDGSPYPSMADWIAHAREAVEMGE